jgi:hypothetical protein
VTRLLARLLAFLLVLGLLPALASSASAQAERADGSDRGQEAVETGSLRDPAAPPAADFATPLPPEAAETRAASAAGCPLSIYPVDSSDASIGIGVVPYHDIAVRLCRAGGSDRVELEVAGSRSRAASCPR